MNTAGAKVRVWSRSFGAFLVTQALGALNDNAFKFTVQMTIVAVVAAHVTTLGGEGGGADTQKASQALQGRYISIAMAVFILPYILFSTCAGFLADRFSKSKVIQWTKLWEVGAMLLGTAALFSGNMVFLFAVLFLMGMQSAFFSPAKFGLLPEALSDEELSYGNGVVELTTFVAIILGNAIGGYIVRLHHTSALLAGMVFVLIALVGYATSFFVPHLAARKPNLRFNWNAPAQIWEDSRIVRRTRPLLLAVIGASYFWFAGALFQNGLLIYGTNELRLDEVGNGLLQAAIGLGIGSGCFLAGRWSHGTVELGLVPFGACLISLFAVTQALTVCWPAAAFANAALLGMAGGLFLVPLMALMQQQAPTEYRGRVIAVANILTCVAIFASAGTLLVMTSIFQLKASQIFLVFGLLTLVMTLYVLWLLPMFLVRFVLWLVVRTIYRITVVGHDNVPIRGPALLVSNHVTWVDFLLIAVCVPRPIRFLLPRRLCEWPPLRWFFRATGAIPIAQDDPEPEVNASLETAARALDAGDLVLIFAEGTPTRTGEITPFRGDLEGIRKRAVVTAPLVPVYLGGLWGSIFSFEGGRFLWKWPKRIPYAVRITFGAPLPSGTTVKNIQTAVERLARANRG